MLINDFSDIETSEYLSVFTEQNPQFILINNEENLGFVKTCNKGMKLAKGNIIVLLNSDTIIPEGFCERIIKCFNSDDKIGIASPISSCSACYYIPMKKNISLEYMNKRLRRNHKCIYPEIITAEGFCYCIRRTVIEKQGLLDEIYGKGYHEESDYSCRASVNGWKNVLIDDLYVYHKSCSSFGIENRAIQIKNNNEVYNSRYRLYRKVMSSLLEPEIILRIKEEMFPLIKYFYFNSTRSKKYLSINFLGLKFKIRKKRRIKN